MKTAENCEDKCLVGDDLASVTNGINKCLELGAILDDRCVSLIYLAEEPDFTVMSTISMETES